MLHVLKTLTLTHAGRCGGDRGPLVVVLALPNVAGERVGSCDAKREALTKDFDKGSADGETEWGFYPHALSYDLCLDYAQVWTAPERGLYPYGLFFLFLFRTSSVTLFCVICVCTCSFAIPNGSCN